MFIFIFFFYFVSLLFYFIFFIYYNFFLLYFTVITHDGQIIQIITDYECVTCHHVFHSEDVRVWFYLTLLFINIIIY